MGSLWLKLIDASPPPSIAPHGDRHRSVAPGLWLIRSKALACLYCGAATWRRAVSKTVGRSHDVDVDDLAVVTIVGACVTDMNAVRACQHATTIDRHWLAMKQRQAWAVDADEVLRKLRCSRCSRCRVVPRMLHPAAADRLGAKVQVIRERRFPVHHRLRRCLTTADHR